MQTQEVTYHTKLVAVLDEGLGYLNYVFEDLEFQDYDYKYFMCVRLPNWEGGSIEIGDVGYVTVKYVREGLDKWFDGKTFIAYKYTNIIFLKFIREVEKSDITNVVLD